MIVENALSPTEDQKEAMQESGPDQPICLINLLKYRKSAAYTDGRDSSFTGKEAYRQYAETVNKLLPEYGGKWFLWVM